MGKTWWYLKPSGRGALTRKQLSTQAREGEISSGRFHGEGWLCRSKERVMQVWEGWEVRKVGDFMSVHLQVLSRLHLWSSLPVTDRPQPAPAPLPSLFTLSPLLDPGCVFASLSVPSIFHLCVPSAFAPLCISLSSRSLFLSPWPSLFPLQPLTLFLCTIDSLCPSVSHFGASILSPSMSWLSLALICPWPLGSCSSKCGHGPAILASSGSC